MNETDNVRSAMEESLEHVEPSSFRDRIRAIVDERPLTPGVLTIKTARGIDSSVNLDAIALRGAGVQLSYEGLRLTRSIIRDEPWDDNDQIPSYYTDLLAADVLVSQGFYHLATTGVASQAVEIIRRFGRNQTHERLSQPENLEESLEVDVMKLAVNTGADFALQSVPASISSYGTDLANELGEYPLPDPEESLRGIDEQIKTHLGHSKM